MKKFIKSLLVLTLSFIIMSQNIIIGSYAQGLDEQPDPLSNPKYREEFQDFEEESDNIKQELNNEKAQSVAYPDIMGVGKVTTSNLNVRKEPNTSSEVVTSLKRGNTAQIISENGDWYKILYYTSSNNKVISDAYVHRDYISFSPVVEKGIDVSKWNGDINWKKVKASGVDYAIIRAGFGTDTVDPYFKDNIQGAINAGVKVGVYWFSYASSPEKAKAEAQKCLQVIEPYKGDISYPVFFDFEQASADYVEDKYGFKVDQALGTKMANTFMQTIESYGYKSGLYTGAPLKAYFSNEILNNSYTWLAHYSYRTTYDQPFYMWQFADDGKVDGTNGPVDMNYTLVDPSQGNIQNTTNLSCQSKSSNRINLSWSSVDEATGYELFRLNSKSNSYELISTINKPGTTYIDKGLSENTSYSYKIRPIRVVNNITTTGKFSDVLTVTTEGGIPDIGQLSVGYKSHVEDYGWQDWKINGQLSGTTGKVKRLEAIEINLKNAPNGAKILYQTHVQDHGWQGWKSNGEMSGTEGQSKQLEAIKIKVENLPGYKVEYRVHVEDYGWQDWKTNGEVAGTEGKFKRIEAIEIRLVEEEILPKVMYRSHVKNDGWQSWKFDGELSGTEGQEKRIEGIEIKLSDAPAGANILYQTHVEDYGWQDWKSNGEMSGTAGEFKRIEAIRIKLDNLPGYRVEYRAHVENDGWQNWRTQDQIAGTEGQAKRIEAIQIRIVKN